MGRSEGLEGIRRNTVRKRGFSSCSPFLQFCLLKSWFCTICLLVWNNFEKDINRIKRKKIRTPFGKYIVKTNQSRCLKLRL